MENEFKSYAYIDKIEDAGQVIQNYLNESVNENDKVVIVISKNRNIDAVVVLK
jgi:beta-lactam-binding protein with PASTA domain